MNAKRYTEADLGSVARRYREDGVALLKRAFSAADLAIIEAAYEHLAAHPTGKKMELANKAGGRVMTDLTNHAAWDSPQFKRLLQQTPVGELALAVGGGAHTWLYYEQIWLKEGEGRRTPWHQDASYLHVEGDNVIRMWITLDPLPPEGRLEFVRGSHRGPLYYPSAFNADDETLPLYQAQNMQPLPDIQGHRSDWDIVTFDTEPGDVVFFHPGTLHGGAPTRPRVRPRTLTLMFVGDDARYVPRPMPLASEISDGQPTTPAELAHLQPGAPFRLAVFPQLR